MGFFLSSNAANAATASLEPGGAAGLRGPLSQMCHAIKAASQHVREWRGEKIGCLGNTPVLVIITVTISAHPTYNRNGSSIIITDWQPSVGGTAHCCHLLGHRGVAIFSIYHIALHYWPRRMTEALDPDHHRLKKLHIYFFFIAF